MYGNIFKNNGTFSLDLHLIYRGENLRKGGNSFANKLDLLMRACSFACEQPVLLTAKKWLN